MEDDKEYVITLKTRKSKDGTARVEVDHDQVPFEAALMACEYFVALVASSYVQSGMGIMGLEGTVEEIGNGAIRWATDSTWSVKE